MTYSFLPAYDVILLRYNNNVFNRTIYIYVMYNQIQSPTVKTSLSTRLTDKMNQTIREHKEQKCRPLPSIH